MEISLHPAEVVCLLVWQGWVLCLGPGGPLWCWGCSGCSRAHCSLQLPGCCGEGGAGLTSQAVGRREAASGGFDWILGRISSWKRWLGIGMGFPEKW